MGRPAAVSSWSAAAADEADPERDEVAVPVVEPRLGGGTVEHPVGLVVGPVHLELELQDRW